MLPPAPPVWTPPPLVPLLSATVTLVSVAVPPFDTPPPLPAELPLIVVFVIVSVPIAEGWNVELTLSTPPPAAPVPAVLPLIVLPTTVSAPPLFARPPPLTLAVLAWIVLLARFTTLAPT